MKLDDADQRCKLVDDLTQQSFKNDSIFVHGEENYYEWLSNIRIMNHLIVLGEMTCTEKILVDTVADMESVRVNDDTDREFFLNIVRVKLRHFVETLLLPELEGTLKSLRYWQFKSDVGKKFHRNAHKKLDALLEKYQNLYDL